MTICEMCRHGKLDKKTLAKFDKRGLCNKCETKSLVLFDIQQRNRFDRVFEHCGFERSKL